MRKVRQSWVGTCTRFIFFGFAMLVLNVSIAAAQTPMPRATPPPSTPVNPNGDKDEPPLTSFEEEIRAKRAIKIAEKDHQENVDRAKQLQVSLKDKTTIDRESAKKIERLEKLTKKIRNEAGGGDEEVKIVDRPSDISGAVKQIAESAQQLSKTVQDTPRQVVSAGVIGNANVLLELVKMLRALDTHPQ
jgi:hypothetical protein